MSCKVNDEWWERAYEEHYDDLKAKGKTDSQIYDILSEMLTKDEYIVYTMVKKFEEMEEYDLMQEGLSKFSKMNPKAYMTLLD